MRAGGAGIPAFYTRTGVGTPVAEGKVTVAEAEILLDGHIDPDLVITPGVYVNRLTTARARVKVIEQRTVRPRVLAGSEA